MAERNKVNLANTTTMDERKWLKQFARYNDITVSALPVCGHRNTKKAR